ncbi:hypothetical protein C2G38_2153119 [Gigaspora rosea]|uniref:Uncharacterized protein n=1 Tax=Gigaspora rosea TaxID=44941 RepID=A0A397W7K0_9GLOM|nr:hypothetical protein C2G38_2153119 [Gigaspora rosea]
MSHNQLTSNNNVQTEEQDLDKVFDSDEPRPWFPTGDLKNLPTEIYSDCTLSKAEHQKILSVLHPIDNIEKVEEENARSKLYNDANKENLDSLHQTNLKDIYWKDFLFNIPVSIVATGYSPEWNIKPQLKISTIKKNTLNHLNMDTVKKEIQNLVTTQAIQQISACSYVLLPTF